MTPDWGWISPDLIGSGWLGPNLTRVRLVETRPDTGRVGQDLTRVGLGWVGESWVGVGRVGPGWAWLGCRVSGCQPKLAQM